MENPQKANGQCNDHLKRAERLDPPDNYSASNIPSSNN